MNNTPYIGRFAPSPSGPLHLGSLVAALGSYLQAKAQNGQWLLRIEDLDPPREMLGASENIIKTLEQLGLLWDRPVIFQSQRLDIYEKYLSILEKQQLTYRCQCSRAQIKARGGIYQGYCRDKNHNQKVPFSLRLKAQQTPCQFEDGLRGNIINHNQQCEKDFILKRKDGYFSYNMAVVIDDYEQGISEVVRGADLVESTFGQLHLQQLLQFKQPKYLHLPMVVNNEGHKLSKHNHAKSLNLDKPEECLVQSLTLLGQNPPKSLYQSTPKDIIQWAIAHWELCKVPNQSITMD